MSKLEEKYVTEVKPNVESEIGNLFDIGRKCGFNNDEILSDIADAIANMGKIKVTITIAKRYCYF